MVQVRIWALRWTLLGCLMFGCGSGGPRSDQPNDSLELQPTDLTGDAPALADGNVKDSSATPDSSDSEGHSDGALNDTDLGVPADGWGPDGQPLDGVTPLDVAEDAQNDTVADLIDLSDLADLADGDTQDSADVTIPPQQCPLFLPATALATVTWPALSEASGLAASARNPGLFWVHNDSGDTARFFVLNVAGQVLGEFALKGITARVETYAIITPETYLYIGDVGDNSLVRPKVQVIRFPEPVVDLSLTPFSMELEGATSFDVVYPEGKSHNCETLAVDPLDGTVVLVNKTGDAFSSVFTVLLPELPAPQPIPMAFLTTIPIGISTGGDFSPDGSTLLVRSYWQAFVWQRFPTLENPEMPSLAQMLSGPACSVPVVFQGLGESVTFARDQAGYYTLSEGVGQSLYFYERIPNGLGP